MINLIEFGTPLISALEQFEIISFFYPGLDNIFTFILWVFLPKELFNNLNLNILVILYFLVTLFDIKINYCEKSEIEFEEYSNFANLDENENILISGNTCSDSYSSFDKLSKVSIFLLINIVNFVYKQILENLTYKKNIFLNYTLSLFLLILFCNVMGLVPYSLTVTSYLIVALYLSGMSFFANLIIGIRVYSWNFFKFFVPGGVEGALLVLMVIIELVSYITRLFSMAIRLFANMLSGHALVKILSGLVFMSFSDLYFFGLINIIFNLVVIAVTALEVVVAGLQAYVFVILSVVYTNEAIMLH